ncbi:hypothetical protein [Helicobacter phage FrGC43A]|uniref:hypothetical protein n=1 Tax=Helicobacter pylori TaxID=210 RepID=UPI000983ECD2|nr:hypothetical protein [Helicobacter pylori]ANT42878.1 hypothetical protein [Helicobacter phage FrGC43A]PUD75346.1 hypothetical protein C2R64_05365 [Helicobacter pylori]WRG94652.1 hypothetical protein FNE14_03240 [Helicobacter pylori]
MWDEKFLKVIPVAVFLFCVLEIFELGLIVIDMNKTEKLEKDLKTNLGVSEMIAKQLNKHLEGMQLGHFQDKKIKIK